MTVLHLDVIRLLITSIRSPFIQACSSCWYMCSTVIQSVLYEGGKQSRCHQQSDMHNYMFMTHDCLKPTTFNSHWHNLQTDLASTKICSAVTAVNWPSDRALFSRSCDRVCIQSLIAGSNPAKCGMNAHCLYRSSELTRP